MSQKQIVNFQFKFNEISTLKFFVDNRPDAIRNVNLESYNFHISGANFINSENKILGFDIIINISTNDDTKIKVCELIQRVSFYVNNFDEVIQIKGKEIFIPDQIMSHLFSLSLSSVRGVLNEKLFGSILAGLILPPVNVNKIIDGMKAKPNSK